MNRNQYSDWPRPGLKYCAQLTITDEIVTPLVTLDHVWNLWSRDMKSIADVMPLSRHNKEHSSHKKKRTDNFVQ